MKLRSFFLASSLALLAACSNPAQLETREGFNCVPSLGGCWTEYEGPRTPEAALAYFRDAENAVRWVIDQDQGRNIENVFYNPARGELVIQLQRRGNRLQVPLRDILAHFNTNALHVENALIMDNYMSTVVLSARNPGSANRFGRARFWALRGIPFEVDVDLASDDTVRDARRAFAPVRRDVFGNVTIRVR